jgi:hypothetical protein
MRFAQDDSIVVRKERKEEAGPSTPLKWASLRMTALWLGRNEKKKQVLRLR